MNKEFKGMNKNKSSAKISSIRTIRGQFSDYCVIFI